jgi:hypothetical protein
MPTYILPSTLVFQDFQEAPAAAANPLRAHVTGPHAQLVRYADDDERALGLLGAYDSQSDTPYAWPNRQAGGVVDRAYVKLFCKDALLQYFVDSIGERLDDHQGRRVEEPHPVGHGQLQGQRRDLPPRRRPPRPRRPARRRGQGPLRVRVRHADLDVRRRVRRRPVARPRVGRDRRRQRRTATATGSAVQVRLHGPFNAVKISAVSGTTYNPYPTGKVTEKYTVVVTQSSTGGDFTTARLRVISASGLDDADDVQPASEGVATTWRPTGDRSRSTPTAPTRPRRTRPRPERQPPTT